VGVIFTSKKGRCKKNFVVLCVGAAESTKLTLSVGWPDSMSRPSRLPKLAEPTLLGWPDSMSWPSWLPKLVEPTLLWLTELARREIPKSTRFGSSEVVADLDDWRTPILRYHMIQTPKLKYSAEYIQLCTNELYPRIVEDLLTKRLGSDQAKMVMEEVYGLWSSSSRRRLGIIQRGGLKFCLKLYGHIAYLGIVLGVENHATKGMRSNKFGKRSPS